jgi:histidinol-phosphate aminotransferase
VVWLARENRRQIMTLLDHLNPAIAALRPYEPGRPIESVAREYGLDPDAIIKLASNESALGPSPAALRALEEAIYEVHFYPDGGGWDLRHAIAEKHGVGFESVILGNGSNEILELLGHAFLGAESSAVFSAHAFIVYKLVTQLFGSEGIEVPMATGLVHDLDAMLAAIRPDTRVVFVCNPNNPTGTAVAPDALQRFCKAVPEDVLIVLDEAYAEIALTALPPSISWLSEQPNILICRTFSKAYGLAGLRIGYGIGHPDVCASLNRARQPFNANRLAQIAALAALGDDTFVSQCRELYAREKAYLEEGLVALGLPFIESFANFLLVEVGDGAEIANTLREAEVIVRPVAPYQLPKYIRVTYGNRSENRKFLTALATVLGREAAL